MLIISILGEGTIFYLNIDTTGLTFCHSFSIVTQYVCI